MKSCLVTIVSIGILAGHCSVAIAAPDLPEGFFVGASAGGAGLFPRAVGLVETGETEHDNGALKLHAGYWFSQHWGVAASYVRLGKFTQTYTSGSFRGRSESAGISLLGRLPINRRWSVLGKLALNYNKTSELASTGDPAQFAKLRGDSVRLVFPGLEIDYRINQAATLFFEMESRGRVADGINTGYAGLGLRWHF